MKSDRGMGYIAGMELLVNGETKACPGSPSLAQFIEQLGMRHDRVAVELNREIVPRTQWDETQLQDGDRLEIVHFVGGGSGSQYDWRLIVCIDGGLSHLLQLAMKFA
jgi:sulfur carrier protein